ncbi:MAG TPA: chromosomal replication initiator DnaA [Rhodopila sp.]|nr:chromosomal replication initiator DnaA [Rhodopila sp.]
MMRCDRLQLLLPLPERHGFDSRDFIAAASNRDALAWLEADWPDRRLALWGEEGCGKSHLLHIWAERHGGTVLSGPALTDAVMTDAGALPASGCVALDDADLVGPDEVLLHLLNTARDRALSLLLSGRSPPARWPARLPDLSSRLRAITAVEIGVPDDALLSALLMRLLAERQLYVPPSIQAWLLARLPRSPSVLRSVVARLDRESLVTGRAITRPLAMDVLRSAGLITDDPAGEDSKTDGEPAWG